MFFATTPGLYYKNMNLLHSGNSRYIQDLFYVRSFFLAIKTDVNFQIDKILIFNEIQTLKLSEHILICIIIHVLMFSQAWVSGWLLCILTLKTFPI